LESAHSKETPVGQALASVLSEIDAISRASMNSITLATMQRIIERQQSAPLAASPTTNKTKRAVL
jgi:hypothetical protein